MTMDPMAACLQSMLFGPAETETEKQLQKTAREIHTKALTKNVGASTEYLMSRGHSREDAEQLAAYMVQTKNEPDEPDEITPDMLFLS